MCTVCGLLLPASCGIEIPILMSTARSWYPHFWTFPNASEGALRPLVSQVAFLGGRPGAVRPAQRAALRAARGRPPRLAQTPGRGVGLGAGNAFTEKRCILFFPLQAQQSPDARGLRQHNARPGTDTSAERRSREILRQKKRKRSVPGAALVLSPRNAEKAAELAQSLRNARVAASNQDVVDACDVVVRRGEGVTPGLKIALNSTPTHFFWH